MVQSYIYLKWKNLGSKYYAIGLIMYILLVGFLSLFAVTVNHPLSVYCKCHCVMMYVVMIHVTCINIGNLTSNSVPEGKSHHCGKQIM